MDIDDVLSHVEDLRETNPQKIIELHDYLEQELKPIVQAHAGKNSLLSSVEKAAKQPPISGDKYLSHMDSTDPTERAELFKELLAFYEKFANLSSVSRIVLHLIITRGEQGKHFRNSKYQLGIGEIENLIQIPAEKLDQTIRFLDKSPFLGIDSEEGVWYAEVSYKSDVTGSDIIPMLVDCLAKDEKLLQRLFIDADFTLLD
jgi:hypothetical protein